MATANPPKRAIRFTRNIILSLPPSSSTAGIAAGIADNGGTDAAGLAGIGGTTSAPAFVPLSGISADKGGTAGLKGGMPAAGIPTGGTGLGAATGVIGGSAGFTPAFAKASAGDGGITGTAGPPTGGGGITDFEITGGVGTEGRSAAGIDEIGAGTIGGFIIGGVIGAIGGFIAGATGGAGGTGKAGFKAGDGATPGFFCNASISDFIVRIWTPF